MKKYLILATAAIAAMCSCSKSGVNTPEREVTFQVANYVGQTKALEGSAFTYKSFGCYAWSKATLGLYFMDNETISLQAGEWKPSTTYYWPKKANVDFISYYPREEAGGYVLIEPEKISYTDFNAIENQIDLLYADKAVDYGYAGQSGASEPKSVPAFFHHALAQVNISAKLAYRAKTINETSGAVTKYRWEVTLTDAVIENLHYIGSLELNLSKVENEDLEKTYPWIKPANELWTVTEHKAGVSGDTGAMSIEETSLFKQFYVIPQALEDQKLSLTFNVKTYRSIDGAPEELFLDETGVKASTLLSAGNVESWKINQATSYLIVLAPTAGSGKNKEKPDDPVDPDDPDLKDAEITFDPAVEGWNSEKAAVVINL